MAMVITIIRMIIKIENAIIYGNGDTAAGDGRSLLLTMTLCKYQASEIFSNQVLTKVAKEDISERTIL